MPRAGHECQVGSGQHTAELEGKKGLPPGRASLCVGPRLLLPYFQPGREAWRAVSAATAVNYSANTIHRLCMPFPVFSWRVFCFTPWRHACASYYGQSRISRQRFSTAERGARALRSRDREESAEQPKPPTLGLPSHRAWLLDDRFTPWDVCGGAPPSRGFSGGLDTMVVLSPGLREPRALLGLFILVFQ